MSDIATPEDVLDFWFGPLAPGGVPAGEKIGLWFKRSDETDATIRSRFGATLTAARAGELSDWESEPRSWLALVVVLDQFSRNLFRDDARAWSHDPTTRAIARRGLEQGWDLQLHVVQRAFIYLTLEHSEELADQDASVAKFEALLADASEAQRGMAEGWLDYAKRHREPIARFGRFPHRNAVLGRENTPEEQAYLDAGGGFG